MAPIHSIHKNVIDISFIYSASSRHSIVMIVANNNFRGLSNVVPWHCINLSFCELNLQKGFALPLKITFSLIGINE